MQANPWLVAGAALDAAAGIAHLACIAGGAAWYRFLGAGKRMVRKVERGDLAPVAITIAIGGALLAGSLYALSGAGIIVPLSNTCAVLVGMTAIFLLRAAALPLLFRIMPDRSPSFLVWSSVIVLGMGLVHLIGLMSTA